MGSHWFPSLATLLAAGFLAGCASDGAPLDPSPRGDGDIPALMASHDVPGLAITIIREAAIDTVLTFGVIDTSGAPVTSATRFQAASLSKPVAATAALRLAAGGTIDLDGDIDTVLSGWHIPRNPFTGSAPVTVRHLLAHQAGTTVSGFPGYGEGEALPDLLAVLNGTPPANTPPVTVTAAPGSRFRYSGGGFVILQQALTDRTGQPFADLVGDQVLSPLGMNGSIFSVAAPDGVESAAGHDATGMMLPGRHHRYPELAAAGLWSTPSDLARFLIDLHRAWTGESGRLLDPAMALAMLTPVANSPMGLGMGVWSRNGEVWFGHNGANAGYRCLMLMHRESGAGAVLMCNGENGAPLIDRLVYRIGTAEGWPGY